MFGIVKEIKEILLVFTHCDFVQGETKLVDLAKGFQQMTEDDFAYSRIHSDIRNPQSIEIIQPNARLQVNHFIYHAQDPVQITFNSFLLSKLRKS
jgi:hypothetical protein